MRLFGLVLVGMVLTGCSRSPVPVLTPAELTSPRLEGLSPRAVALEVSDRRPVNPDDRKATEAHLVQAFGEVFGRQKVEVVAGVSNTLAVTLTQPSKVTGDLDPASCVEMQGKLTLADGRRIEAKSLGCSEIRNGVGMSYGANVSGAFQTASELLLEYLDKTYAEMQ